MSGKGFYLYMLLIFVGLLQAFYFFKHHFSGADELKVQVARLQEQNKREQTKTFVAYHEAESVRQEVAALLPNQIHAKDNYSARSLASVLQVQEPLEFDSTAKILKRGKEFFAAKKYREAVTVLKSLVDRYPESKDLPEAYFLLAEAYYQGALLEDCIDTVDTMVALFPESELTGFALLRLTSVYLDRGLVDEAMQVLQTVRHNFAYNSEIVEQSARLLKKAER